MWSGWSGDDGDAIGVENAAVLAAEMIADGVVAAVDVLSDSSNDEEVIVVETYRPGRDGIE